MKFYLIVAKGKHKGMPIEIKVDLFMIGSRKMCQLRSKLPGIDREHCALVMRGRKVFIRAMSRDNPTLVNGSSIPAGDEWPVHAGDLLEVGPLEFMVQLREKVLSQKDLEEWAAGCLDADRARNILDDTSVDEFHKPTNASQAAGAIIDRLQAQRGLVMGRLRIGRDPSGITTVRFNDSHLVDEAEIALIKKELCEYLGKPNLRILLDFKNVRRMATAAVNMLGDFYLWLKPWGSTLAFCRVRSDLQGILTTMGLSIPRFYDKKMALAAKW